MPNKGHVVLVQLVVLRTNQPFGCDQCGDQHHGGEQSEQEPAEAAGRYNHIAHDGGYTHSTYSNRRLKYLNDILMKTIKIYGANHALHSRVSTLTKYADSSDSRIVCTKHSVGKTYVPDMRVCVCAHGITIIQTHDGKIWNGITYYACVCVSVCCCVRVCVNTI